MIRNRQNFTILLAMPLVLIFIIKFAIGDLMTEEIPEIDATIAIAEQSNEAEQIERIKDELLQLPIPEESKEQVTTNLSQFQPIQILKNQVFGNEELKKMITLEEIAPEQVEEAKREEKYAAIIEVPKNFSYHLIRSSFVNDEPTPELTLFVDKGEELVTTIVNDLLLNYEEQMKTNMVLERHGAGNLIVPQEDVEGTVTSISKVEPISTTLYYVVGMSVMFVLYIASTMGGYAFEEKQIHVFDRIILANVSRWVYFTGTFFASSILAFAQLMILYGFSAVIFGVRWPSLFQFFVITVLISLAVGGMASLITSINYRFNSETASSVFSSVIITMVAFLGGSFFPVGDLSGLVKFLGNITPNGAGMTAYLTSAQGYGFSEIGLQLLYLASFTIVMIVAAALTFPTKGEQA